MTTLAEHILDISNHSGSHEMAHVDIPTMDVPTAGSLLIPGAGFTIAAGDLRPYFIKWGGFLYTLTSAGASAYLDLYEDGVAIGRTGLTMKTTGAVSWRRGVRRRMMALTSHTYQLYLVATGGTVRFLSESVGGTAPSFIMAVTG